ncbi:MAG: zinc ribbon domain-containing protein [Candidatus Desulfofervidus auxilii]|nr:zinc ribbon domain-containing protein [Candidatus Desulfofervidus auxilii]
MPIYEFFCEQCGHTFEIIQGIDAPAPNCPICGGKTKKLISSIFFKVATDEAIKRVEKRFKDYIRWGKYKDAAKFADKAAQYLKHDKIKRMQESIQKKLEKKKQI